MRKQWLRDTVLSKLDRLDRRASRFCCDKDWNYSSRMAGLMEVLEVQRIVPNLLDRLAPKVRCSNLKFNDDNN